MQGPRSRFSRLADVRDFARRVKIVYSLTTAFRDHLGPVGDQLVPRSRAASSPDVQARRGAAGRNGGVRRRPPDGSPGRRCRADLRSRRSRLGSHLRQIGSQLPRSCDPVRRRTRTSLNRRADPCLTERSLACRVLGASDVTLPPPLLAKSRTRPFADTSTSADSPASCGRRNRMEGPF
jgi:hypothetical protein